MGLGGLRPERGWLGGKGEVTAGRERAGDGSGARSCPFSPPSRAAGSCSAGRGWAAWGQHPKPCSTRGARARRWLEALPLTRPRVQQRDAKSHHANYANHINYSCYSEVSPESSLARCSSALLTHESRSRGSRGARGARGCGSLGAGRNRRHLGAPPEHAAPHPCLLPPRRG